MEAMEEFVGPKDHTHIVKGKRTKRQRPQSPIPFTIATNSSSGDEDIITNSSGGEFTDSTEEEEDMANCLILLAQGRSRETSQKPNDDDDVETELTFKFNSKRYTGKAGMYVYQCKTCSRTFPSFQALGGHRASHKKPKAAAAADYQNDNGEVPQYKNLYRSTSLTDLQLSNNYTKVNKVHECSVCGAEFSSGQALGGHMRRHRGPASANTTLSLDQLEETNKTRNGLSLDLNLPAPEFALASAPTLVDCHY
uniref:Putative C2H2-type zinc finger family protein n=1 Tax=Davidia involucrata TaxID=16924 RepID=A0A5B7C658_DAVIN